MSGYEAPYVAISAEGEARLLLVCDHASNAVPAEYGALGLPAASFERHIAYDIGARELTRSLAEGLGAPALIAGFSRLLIDPNRGEDDPTLVMKLSDGEIIPGNAAADAAEIRRRIERYHRPYHQAIDSAIDRAMAKGLKPVIVSIHSFTPSWRTRARPWHCGILWAGDKASADYCLAYLRREPGLVVGDNQPYSGALEGDSMDRHGTRRNLPHVLIEVRQDLLSSREGIAAWAARLKPLLAELAKHSRAP